MGTTTTELRCVPVMQVLLSVSESIEPDTAWLDELLYQRCADQVLEFCSEQPAVLEAAGLFPLPGSLELSVQLSSPDEIRHLNRQYRGIDKPTNVLSFPAEMPPLHESVLSSRLDGPARGSKVVQALGDIVLCPQVILQESQAQSSSLDEHRAHLVVHGLLHLYGFDHQQEQQAEIMESMEIRILSGMGISNPYQVD